MIEIDSKYFWLRLIRNTSDWFIRSRVRWQAQQGRDTFHLIVGRFIHTGTRTYRAYWYRTQFRVLARLARGRRIEWINQSTWGRNSTRTGAVESHQSSTTATTATKDDTPAMRTEEILFYFWFKAIETRRSKFLFLRFNATAILTAGDVPKRRFTMNPRGTRFKTKIMRDRS